MLKGQSFPLIFLMLLVAFSAILARIAMPIVQSFQTHDVYGSAVATDQWISWSAAMVFTGAVVGFFIGWIREYFWPGAVVGFVLGSVIGAVCTPFLGVPAALTALCDLTWIFISLILLTFGTILIERRCGNPQGGDQYVKTLQENPEQS
ncbi:hypothetical protein C5Y96_08900 [Blastopirellula marina]|uniref:Uncharacterized protein n=1 Tax=Blastopirellula marina TaxID=124 RepID=A0A2S8FUM9_9BACT|nr:MULTISPECIES: hypothetical protein [Pirellulaceae]PQO35760.1 hypothetical protein C5Y96_08900 [Blastopirellula marina]RCS53334.1 hypothetical protein DTL36_08910 [Bremerella cremea]